MHPPVAETAGPGPEPPDDAGCRATGVARRARPGPHAGLGAAVVELDDRGRAPCSTRCSPRHAPWRARRRREHAGDPTPAAAPARPTGPAPCSPPWAWATSRRPTRASCPVASSDGSPWPRPCTTARRCCSPTSRPSGRTVAPGPPWSGWSRPTGRLEVRSSPRPTTRTSSAARRRVHHLVAPAEPPVPEPAGVPLRGPLRRARPARRRPARRARRGALAALDDQPRGARHPAGARSGRPLGARAARRRAGPGPAGRRADGPRAGGRPLGGLVDLVPRRPRPRPGADRRPARARHRAALGGADPVDRPRRPRRRARPAPAPARPPGRRHFGGPAAGARLRRDLARARPGPAHPRASASPGAVRAPSSRTSAP